MYLIPRRAADRSAFGSTLRVATALAAGWAALQAFRLLHSKHHRISPEPFSHTEAAPERRFLIVGDGTGVGIGSADPRSTVAGRLSAAFPGTEIVNQARDGACTVDIAEQIAASSGRFDLILIFVGGGNDVTRFSSYEAVALAGHVALDFAKSRSDQVAVILPPDVGTAPLWAWPLAAVFTRRAEVVRRAWQLATSERDGVHLVELRLPRDRDPFRIARRRFYSPDGVHPSADGYALWFAQITRQVPFFGELRDRSVLV
jgi:lysophospholipase L1-like esterase